MKNDPFLEIRFSLDKVEPDFLEDSEIQKLISKEIDIPRLSQVRDIFVFCCFTFVALTNVCLIINKLQINNRGIGNGLETTCLHHFA